MPEWKNKQRQLKRATVACIGSGGVKTTLLTACVAAGIGNLRIIDFDKVELSNLNRQTLFTISDIGRNKAEVASKYLHALNPEVNIDVITEKLTADNVHEFLKGYHYIFEGGDSPYGRSIINEYCLETKKPMTHASAQFSYGYVFSMLPEKRTACMNCLFPRGYHIKSSTGPVPVWVVPVQIAGSLGASEAIKYFLGYKNEMVLNKQLVFSSILLSEEFEYIPVNRMKKCPTCSKYY